MDDFDALVIAYIFIWLGLFLYVLFIHLKQSKLIRDVEILEESVKSYGKAERKRRKRNQE